MSAKTDIVGKARFEIGAAVRFKKGLLQGKIGSKFAYRVAGSWQLRYAVLVPQSGYERVIHATENELERAA